MNRKVIGILVTIGLILSLCLVASTPVMAADTWYVSTTGDDMLADGSAGLPWLTIQHAVDNAAAGDTIIVEGGTYPETITVNKSLIIRAKSGETVNVQPSFDDGFNITADNVTIDGFTIRWANDGIYLNGASSCTITGNSLVNCGTRSIALSNSANTNVILGNTCTGNAGNYTMYLYNSYGNIITNNTCTGDGDGYGIFVYDSDGNTVAGNSCSNFRCGIYIEKSKDNIVTANICSHNSHYGIFLSAVDADDLESCNSFMFNTLDDNDYGLYIYDADTNAALVYFHNNNITNNTTGVQNNGTGELDASANYWGSGENSNSTDTIGNVNSGSPLAAAVTNTIPEAALVTTSITTSTTTSTATSTTTEVETEITTNVQTTTQTVGGMQVVTLVETSTSTTTETSIITLLNPTTTTEIQLVTSTNTLTSTLMQSVTTTDTQSLTLTVTVPQTVSQTTTATLTLTEETLDWPLTIIIAVAGLLAGGLIVTIIIRKQ